TDPEVQRRCVHRTKNEPDVLNKFLRQRSSSQSMPQACGESEPCRRAAGEGGFPTRQLGLDSAGLGNLGSGWARIAEVAWPSHLLDALLVARRRPRTLRVARGRSGPRQSEEDRRDARTTTYGQIAPRP